MIINQEYKIWKKEAPYNYDFYVLRSLDWPTYTFQWLPETTTLDHTTAHYAIIASHHLEPENTQLLKVQIEMPNDGKRTPFPIQNSFTSMIRRTK